MYIRFNFFLHIKERERERDSSMEGYILLLQVFLEEHMFHTRHDFLSDDSDDDDDHDHDHDIHLCYSIITMMIIIVFE